MSETMTKTDTTPVCSPPRHPDADWPAMRAAGYIAAGHAVDAGEWILTVTDDVYEQETLRSGPPNGDGSWRYPVAVHRRSGQVRVLAYWDLDALEDDQIGDDGEPIHPPTGDWGEFAHLYGDAAAIIAVLAELYGHGRLAVIWRYADGLADDLAIDDSQPYRLVPPV